MFKVLIVDDESLSRFVVKDILERNFGQQVKTYEANNGRNAISICRSERPDLVIMDIQMPGKNGLDASREILRHYPDTYVLILSAYDEFEFAQQAMQIGVKGFLLKPIREEEGLATIQRAFDSISTGAKSEANALMNQDLRSAKPFIQAEMVDLLAKGINSEAFQIYQKLMREKIENGFFLVVQIMEDELGYIAKQFDEIMQNVREILLNHDSSLPYYLVGAARFNQISILFPISNLNKEDGERDSRQRIADHIFNKVTGSAHVAVRIGIGDYVAGVSELYISYHHAITSLQKLRFGSVGMFQPEQMEKDKTNAPYPQQLELSLVNAMRYQDKAAIQSSIDAIIDYFSTTVRGLEVLKTYSYEMLTVCSKTIREIAWLDISQAMKFYQQLSHYQNSVEVVEQLREMLNRMTFPLLGNEVVPYDSYKTTVAEYILQNLAIVTLDSAAQKVYLTPQYFSRVFKEEFKINFSEYLKDLRLSAVKTMLRENKVSLDEICNKVGYTHNAYFTKLFKRETGLTPIRYRQKMLGIERK